MAVRLLAVTFCSDRVDLVARFWATMLEREIVDHDDGVLLAGDNTSLGLRFAPRLTDRFGQNENHLHLTSTSRQNQRQTVATAVELGARHVEIGQTPEEGHVVLADPGNNLFCVIEPDNSFLAGCGFLGEYAGDGSREVGLFWSRALDWPLVWDQDQETAVQSPGGGTKVAWGGPPIAPKQIRADQRFYLTTEDSDPVTEADRLISLGAKRLPDGADGTMALADPDGNEFQLGHS